MGSNSDLGHVSGEALMPRPRAASETLPCLLAAADPTEISSCCTLTGPGTLRAPPAQHPPPIPSGELPGSCPRGELLWEGRERSCVTGLLAVLAKGGAVLRLKVTN